MHMLSGLKHVAMVFSRFFNDLFFIWLFMGFEVAYALLQT